MIWQQYILRNRQTIFQSDCISLYSLSNVPVIPHHCLHLVLSGFLKKILSTLMIVYIGILFWFFICIKLMMMTLGIFSYIYWVLEYSLLGSACSNFLLIFFKKHEFSVLFILICKIY